VRNQVAIHNVVARRAFRWGALGVLLLLAPQALAVPTTVTSADTPGCDVLTVPAAVDQLGRAPAFPPGEQIQVSATTTTTSACVSMTTDNPVIANALVSITNANTGTFGSVWYVANPGTTLSNADGTVNNQPAFRIDASGANSPLLLESSSANGIFEPGETWTFVIQDYQNPVLPPTAINTVGVGQGTTSSGSIIAVGAQRHVDLGIRKDGPANATVGDAIDYTLTATNNGSDDSSGVTVTDALPSEVTFGSASPSQGTCSFAAPTLTCALGPMGHGTSATVTVHTTANSAGTVTNTASVAPSDPQAEVDPVSDNNTGSATTTIDSAGPDFAAHVQSPINADGTSTFNAKRGSIPVKFALTADGSPTCNLPPATISVARVGVLGNEPVDESVYRTPADSGSTFQISDCQYIYFLNSKAMGPGRYQVDILIDSRVVGSASFTLA
jgi:uncharacterized repeat protein (TIGR01451 family)